MALQGWARFFEELSSFLQDVERNSPTTSESYVEYVIRQIMTLISETASDESEADIFHSYTEDLGSLFQTLCNIAMEWEDRLDYIMVTRPNTAETSYRAPVVHIRARGRPRFDINESQLEYLASLSFSWTQIASLLGVSRMTIYRRRVEFNMTEIGTRIHNFSDLKALIRQMKIESPHMGEVLLMGQLRSNGYYVPRARLRHAIREIDPLNTALRVPKGLTPRRPYHVPGPNSLWHIGKWLT